MSWIKYLPVAGVLFSSLTACSSEGSGPAPAAEAGLAWPAAARNVEIVSSVDGAAQPAKFYLPENPAGPLPLLVVLHTWSGDWTQDMGIAWLEQAVSRGWAFVHPDFRGANGRPESTGSEIATADIIDAVRWVRRQAEIDSNRIYLAGTSGGGHMALLTAGRHPEIWAGVSAWVPIFDLARWHGQCAERGLEYAAQMEAACGGMPGANSAVDSQYTLRSSMNVLDRASGVAIEINAGIHDGHGDGSVPVGHALRAFSMLATANGEPEKALSEDEISAFEQLEAVPAELAWEREEDSSYANRPVLFRRQAGPARVTVFEGGHEGLPAAGCEWLARQVRQR